MCITDVYANPMRMNVCVEIYSQEWDIKGSPVVTYSVQFSNFSRSLTPNLLKGSR